MTREDVIGRYNELADEYNDPAAQSGYFVDGEVVDPAVFDHWMDHIQKLFRVEEGMRLLDVGCGSGIFIRLFSAYTKEIYGVDPAEKLVEAAQRQNPDATIKVGNTHQLPFSSMQFDRIFSNSVFLYMDGLQHAKEAIIYLLASLKPGGKLWLGDLALPNFDAHGDDYRRTERSTGWKLQHYPASFLDEICSELGLKGTSITQAIEGKVTCAFRYDYLIEK